MTDARRSRPLRRWAALAGRLVGARALLWLVGGAVIGSLVLAAVETGVAVFLQLLLKSLQLLSKDVQVISLGRLSDLSPTVLSCALLLIGLLRAASQFTVAHSATTATETITARIRRITVHEMLAHLGDSAQPSIVHARVGDIAVRSSAFTFAFATLLSASVQALGLTAAMATAAPGETAIGLAGLAILGGVVLLMNRYNRDVARRIPVELKALMKGIERVARNLTLVRALRTERLESSRLLEAIDRYRKYSVRSGLLGNVAMAMTPFAGTVLIVVILVVSQRAFKTSGLVLISFLYLFMRFVQALSSMTLQFSLCTQYAPQLSESLDLVDGLGAEAVAAAVRVKESAPPLPVVAAATAAQRVPPALDVDGISFRYTRGSKEVLQSVSLHVQAGTQCAIVGGSGRGKSTLLALILGLLVPDEGSILLAGRSPADYFGDPTIRLGYVGAEPYLLGGSIRENLRYGLSVEAIDNDLWEALDSVRLASVIRALPGGLDYQVEESGAGLSAGQKQRLCLARALLNGPHLLVLDEVSANLDAATEAEIAETLRTLQGRTTTIIVSHREGILAHADVTMNLGAANIQSERNAGGQRHR